MPLPADAFEGHRSHPQLRGRRRRTWLAIAVTAAASGMPLFSCDDDHLGGCIIIAVSLPTGRFPRAMSLSITKTLRSAAGGEQGRQAHCARPDSSQVHSDAAPLVSAALADCAAF